MIRPDQIQSFVTANVGFRYSELGGKFILVTLYWDDGGFPQVIQVVTVTATTLVQLKYSGVYPFPREKLPERLVDYINDYYDDAARRAIGKLEDLTDRWESGSGPRLIQ